MKLIPKQFMILGILVMSLVQACAAQALAGNGCAERMELTIAQIRSGKTVENRANAAEHLATLAKDLDRHKVTDVLVFDISTLLDSPDDSVRYWVATALGNIGVPAKSAVPKLLAMLPSADCLNGAITSASGIRYALFKMGIKQPPRPKGCHPIAG